MQAVSAGNFAKWAFRMTLIHFVYPVGESWRIACMPNMVEFHATLYHPNYQRTDDTRAVSCPMCIKSLTFKKSQEGLRDALSGAPRKSETDDARLKDLE